ncbi:MAG: hypothetical protein PHG00_04460 [Methylococcales bacterium]|nr:hypothetical protein [Methylococcales bacterium]
MHAYRTHIVITDPDHTVLRGLPFKVGQRVEIVLLEETEQPAKNEATRTMLEQEWLRAAASNPAFEFLADVDEDIYSLADGKALK